MRVLVIHHESEYFAGAEKMLEYYLQALADSGYEITVAVTAGSRMAELIPPSLAKCWLPPNARFSVGSFLRQVQALRRAHRSAHFDIIHAWAARDWELTAVASRLTGRPALGTLHDHPRAAFISRPRQRLMAWSARIGLRSVACVSDAVRRACLEAGYAEHQLRVVHNGLPSAPEPRKPTASGVFRLGFLGLFAERKGLKGLFQIVDELSAITATPWELLLAGDAQEEQGRTLVRDLKERYSKASWWPRVQWCGWVKRPSEFLSSLDLLICPSSEFDPFPTVLLEAGRSGVAVLAAGVGGVREIVADGRTGWVFERQAWSQAAQQLKRILDSSELARQAGQAAKKRVEEEFAIGRMLAGYLKIYADLAQEK